MSSHSDIRDVLEDIQERMVTMDVLQEITGSFLRDLGRLKADVDRRFKEVANEGERLWSEKADALERSIAEEIRELKERVEAAAPPDEVKAMVESLESRLPQIIQRIVLKGFLTFTPAVDVEETIEVTDVPETPVRPSPSTSTGEETPRRTKRKRIDWSQYPKALDLIKDSCKTQGYSKSVTAKKAIWLEGLKQGMWQDDDTWRACVYTKVDTIYKYERCLSDTRSTP